MIQILAQTLGRRVVVAVLTAAATTLGTKAVEYGFDKLKEHEETKKKQAKPRRSSKKRR